MVSHSSTFHNKMVEKYGEYMGFEYKQKSVTKQTSVASIGINDTEFQASNFPLYSIWRQMLIRANPEYWDKYPTYQNTIIHPEFLSLQKFSIWSKPFKIEKGMQIDKNIIIRDNKIYSPDTCIFIPQEVNKFLTSRQNDRGELPLGVTLHKGKLRTRVNIDGEEHHLGYFISIAEAHKTWQKAKLEQTKVLLSRYNIPQLQFIIDRLQYDINNNLTTEVI